jgi:hypothetical protein
MMRAWHPSDHNDGMYRRVLLGASALIVAGCAGSGGTIAEPQTTVTPVTADAGPDFVKTEPGDVAEPGVSTTQFDVDEAPRTPEIPVVPETGVPGIDSADAFCRAWSEFAGSFQAVGLVSAVGDPGNAFRLEVLAAAAVVDAVRALDSDLPAELEEERVPLVADFAGPYFARASAADGLLDVDVREAFAASWIAQLAEQGVDDPFLEVDLPGVADPTLFAAAVESFSAAFPSIVEDPSLITDVQIPLTDAYLASNCPDQGILGGNDVIVGD